MSKKKKILVLIICILLDVASLAAWIVTKYDFSLGMILIAFTMNVINGFIGIKNEMIVRKILPWEIGIFLASVVAGVVYKVVTGTI